MKKKGLLGFLGIFFISLVSAEVDILGEAKGLFGGASLGGALDVIGYVILAIVICGVVAFFIKQKLVNKKFNKSITFWRRNPTTHLLYADKTIKAMTVRLDSVGNLGYRLKKPYETRNLMPRLKHEAKINTHYVEYCEDGEIIEIEGLVDYDDERRAIKAKFRDHNTELGRSSMHQMNKERYEKTNFWKEHATLLVNIGAIVVIMVFLWLIAKQLVEITSSVSGIVKQAQVLLESNANLIDALKDLLTNTNLLN